MEVVSVQPFISKVRNINSNSYESDVDELRLYVSFIYRFESNRLQIAYFLLYFNMRITDCVFFNV